MAAAKSLKLTRLTLTDFRNYAGLRLETDKSLIALSGPNGAGKTNLLEAISLLSPGRGLRGAGFDELARLGGHGTWAISAELDAADGPVSLGTGWSGQGEGGDGGGQSRLVLIDGHVERSSGALGQHMRMLWLTPAMDRLFAGPASDRRRFLDRLVQAFDPEHGSRVLVFEKVMRERNLLLEDPRADQAWISSLEAHMGEAGVAIAAARLTGIDALQKHIGRVRTGSRFPWGIVAVDGEVEALVSAMPAVRAEDEYRKILADSRGLDRAAGRTLKGPHRSDFSVIHGPKGMPAGQCSTGEQKALLIGLILAQASAVKTETGVAPLLLLDEVAAHLDRTRRGGLFESLEALGSQAWMTGTDAELFDGLGKTSAVLHVEAGTVSDMRKTR
ncbi:DNA replication/repair protein RecF [Aestuariivirga sp.]|uniref:DNA replication/repair protein RecF n=1 Tax=Aestuariivirga sp. TaxID=2650926 RepID=UPI0039E47CFE